MHINIITSENETRKDYCIMFWGYQFILRKSEIIYGFLKCYIAVTGDIQRPFFFAGLIKLTILLHLIML